MTLCPRLLRVPFHCPKPLLVIFFWCVAFLTIFQLRTITLDVPVPSLHSRFLLQNRPADAALQPTAATTTTTTSKTGNTKKKINADFLDLEPEIDRSPALTEAKLVEDIQRRMPNLPIAYWNHRPTTKANTNSSSANQTSGNGNCARFPAIFDLEFNNLYWQTLRTSNGTFQLYGAYMDRRSNNRLGPTIRILGMIDRIEPTVITHCQLWYAGVRDPVTVRTFEYKYVWYKKWGNYKQGIYQPYLTACVVPRGSLYKDKTPESVSLVEKRCDAPTNNLRVIYERPSVKHDFAVCVKGLDFLHEDLSVRLVEWIELLRLLGAHKVFFYELQVHPNISKVLTHYERLGHVHVTPISLAGGQPNAPAFQHLYLTKKTNHKRQNELIPYNDCFYKHMYEYEYIALLDIDEVIVPTEEVNWRGLMDRVLPKALKINKEPRASYNVRNVYFLDDLLHDHGWFKDVPKYMHMLQHVYRAKNFTKPGQYVKCFHNTEKVLTLHNHFPLSCLGGSCTSYPIETSDAQLHHYRADCVKTLKKSCEEYRKTSVMDTTVWKYREPLIERVTDTLKALGYFSNSVANLNFNNNLVENKK